MNPSGEAGRSEPPEMNGGKMSNLTITGADGSNLNEREAGRGDSTGPILFSPMNMISDEAAREIDRQRESKNGNTIIRHSSEDV
jgi:hypothetical protein